MTPRRRVYAGQAGQWDRRRNTSRAVPPEFGSVTLALAALARLRDDDPALVQWILDGHPTLTEAEHAARFGGPYKPRRRRR